MPNYTTSTRRQRESQRAQANKARLATLAWLKRLVLIVVSVVLVGVGGVVAYFWHDESVVNKAEYVIENWVTDISRKHGFVVKQVLIRNRVDAPLATIKEALQVKLGDPMVLVSLREARERLEVLPEIRSASVQRMMPDVLSVVLEERLPVARWRQGREEKLLDREGRVLANKDALAYPELPLLMGGDMVFHAPNFLDLCEGEPVICDQVIGAQWVGGRRWDVAMSGGLLVKLPEENAAAAWERLAMMHNEALLSSHLAVIDLRLSDRIFVTKAQGKSIVASN